MKMQVNPGVAAHPRPVIRTPVRLWSSKDGQFSTEASAIAYDYESVTLQKSDGSMVVVPFARLDFDSTERYEMYADVDSENEMLKSRLIEWNSLRERAIADTSQYRTDAEVAAAESLAVVQKNQADLA